MFQTFKSFKSFKSIPEIFNGLIVLNILNGLNPRYAVFFGHGFAAFFVVNFPEMIYSGAAAWVRSWRTCANAARKWAIEREISLR